MANSMKAHMASRGVHIPAAQGGSPFRPTTATAAPVNGVAPRPFQVHDASPGMGC